MTYKKKTIIISTCLGSSLVYKYLTSKPNISDHVHSWQSDYLHDYNKAILWSSVFGSSRSRWFGQIMNIHLPLKIREPLLIKLASLLKIDLSEAELPLKEYKTFGELFSRHLKQNARPIDLTYNQDGIVMPCDGKISKVSFIDTETLQKKNLSNNGSIYTDQIKGHIIPITIKIVCTGISFSLSHFLGFYKNKTDSTNIVSLSETKQSQSSEKNHLETNSNLITLRSKIAYAIIYLAPHNYHHFHSPCDWIVKERRYISGFTLPVFEKFVTRINVNNHKDSTNNYFQNLFALNERVVLHGHWKYGRFFYVPVGAYNVGSILIDHDQGLLTNIRSKPQNATIKTVDYTNQHFNNSLIEGIPLKKGQHIGEFRLGSTIVLIFEVPDNFVWDVKNGDHVIMGQLLGHINNNQ